jgi:hypothetical protein
MNRENRTLMKNDPVLVAPKDLLVDPRDLPVDPRVHLGAQAVLLVGPRGHLEGQGARLVGPEDHPAKKRSAPGPPPRGQPTCSCHCKLP